MSILSQISIRHYASRASTSAWWYRLAERRAAVDAGGRRAEQCHVNDLKSVKIVGEKGISERFSVAASVLRDREVAGSNPVTPVFPNSPASNHFHAAACASKAGRSPICGTYARIL